MDYDFFWNNLSDLYKDEFFGNEERFLLSENRSSTIFPIFKNEHTETRLDFLSYWLIKHGNNVIVRLTARDIDGVIVDKTTIPVTEYKSNTISFSSMFSKVTVVA